MKQLLTKKNLFCFLSVGLVLSAVAFFGLPEVAQGDVGAVYGGGIPSTRGPWSILGALTEGVGRAILALIFSLFMSLALGFLSFAQLLFSWITSPGFMGVSFTGPDNFFVYENWLMVRDLANVGIILGLVYTGLRTALGIGSFQTTRSLARLIGLAFLINFTPALIGLIISSANIAMDWFLAQGGSSLDFADYMGHSLYFVISPGSDPTIFASFVQLFTLTAGMFFVGIMYFILAATFFVRYIVLWVLIILSPLAFLAFAFSGGERFWRQWWSNFITWTFVGVPIAFFLFLAGQMMEWVKARLFWADTADKMGRALTTVETGEGAGIPGAAFYPIMPVILIYIGYTVSLNLAPKFTTAITTKAKKWSKRAGGWAWGQTKYRGAQAYDAGKQKAREREMLTAAKRLELSTRGWDDKQTGHHARHRTAEEMIKNERATGHEKAIASRYLGTEERIKKRKEEQTRLGKQMENKNAEELMAMVYDSRNPEHRAAAIHKLLSKKHEDDGLKMLGSLSLSEEDALRLYTSLANQGHYKDAKRLAISQAGQHGEAINRQAKTLGEKDNYVQRAMADATSKEARLIAGSYRKTNRAARDKAAEEGKDTAAMFSQNEFMLDSMVGIKRNLNREVFEELPAEEKSDWIREYTERARHTGRIGDINVQATLKALQSWGLLPEEYQSLIRDQQKGNRGGGPPAGAHAHHDDETV